MALTEKQQFKIGFLLKCAEEGLTIDETHERIRSIIDNRAAMTKEAILSTLLKPFTWAGDKAVTLGSKIIPPILSTGSIAALGLPIAGGAAAGYTAAKVTSPQKDMIEDAKHEEIVGEYERLADEAERKAKIKRLQKQIGRKIIALTPDQQ